MGGGEANKENMLSYDLMLIVDKLVLPERLKANSDDNAWQASAD